MTIQVARVVVVVDGVPPVHVVDQPVAVVVDPVVRNLGSVPEDPSGELAVRELEPTVDDGDDDIGASGRLSPCPCHPEVLEGPLVGPERLVHRITLEELQDHVWHGFGPRRYVLRADFPPSQHRTFALVMGQCRRILFDENGPGVFD